MGTNGKLSVAAVWLRMKAADTRVSLPKLGWMGLATCFFKGVARPQLSKLTQDYSAPQAPQVNGAFNLRAPLEPSKSLGSKLKAVLVRVTFQSKDQAVNLRATFKTAQQKHARRTKQDEKQDQNCEPLLNLDACRNTARRRTKVFRVWGRAGRYAPRRWQRASCGQQTSTVDFWGAVHSVELRAYSSHSYAAAKEYGSPKADSETEKACTRSWSSVTHAVTHIGTRRETKGNHRSAQR